LLHCPDQKGIISEVTRFISDNRGNIVYLDQYVDQVDSMFFMRIEWELDGFLIPREKIADYISTLYSQRYQISFSLYFSDKRPRMAIFVSKLSHCLYDLLARWKSGEWDVDIPCIISNHEDLRYVADQFDIPYYVFSINKDHSNKAEVEAAEMALLKEKDVSFIVLARYMQIISDEMIAAYPHHIINIHHSFLPAFIGAKPYHQAYERGVKIIGATSHYVTADLDAGPIIEQDVARITHKDTPETPGPERKDLEKIVLSRAVSEAHRAQDTHVQEQDHHFLLTVIRHEEVLPDAGAQE
jgi:formyltetrahydrofolate deformylase